MEGEGGGPGEGGWRAAAAPVDVTDVELPKGLAIGELGARLGAGGEGGGGGGAMVEERSLEERRAFGLKVALIGWCCCWCCCWCCWLLALTALG